jgi:hypothetical protein
MHSCEFARKRKSSRGENLSEKTFRVFVVALLGALVGLQGLTLYRQTTPLTLASFLAAPDDKKGDLIRQVPLVRVQGGSVDVEVRNTPLEVEVSQ